MRELRRIGLFFGGTAVLFIGIALFFQARPAASAPVGASPIYLPVILTPDCAVYFDDFSDPNSGWTVGDDAIVTLAYINDEYSIASKQGGLVLGSVGPLGGRDNYVAKVEARFNAAPTDGFYGLLFGVKREGANNSVSEYYLFAVEPSSQEYGLFYRDPAAVFDPIVSPTVSGAINTGTAVNTLTAARDGNQITLKVNDTILGTWTDGRITGDTQVGMAMRAHPNNPVADARFDNFISHLCIDDELNGTFNGRQVRTPNENRAATPLTIQDAFPGTNE